MFSVSERGGWVRESFPALSRSESFTLLYESSKDIHRSSCPSLTIRKTLYDRLKQQTITTDDCHVAAMHGLPYGSRLGACLKPQFV